MKRAIDMTPEERQAALESIRKGPPPEPMPTDVKAKDMTQSARQEWLAEHKRRWGL
jgi:hypothetical protein